MLSKGQFGVYIKILLQYKLTNPTKMSTTTHQPSSSSSSSSSSLSPPEEVSKTTFTWQYENFSANANDGFVASPHFTLKNDPHQVKCYLTILPNGISIRNAPWSKTHTFIYLWLVSDHTNVTLEYQISIVDRDGNKFNTQEGHAKFMSNKKVLYNWQYNISREHLLDPENGLLANDTLTIYCEVDMVRLDSCSSDNSTNSRKSRTAKEEKKNMKIIEDLRSLLQSEKFADVTLVIGEKELKVHKNILAARSPVFAAMFEHDCEERRLSRVEIIDLSVDVCEELLRYIYTDSVESMEKYATELLEASDKYQLDSLKAACEKWLCTSITVESVSNCLLLAEMHNAQQLRSKCIDFITDKPKQVMATSGWKGATKARPELGLLLFQHIVHKMDI